MDALKYKVKATYPIISLMVRRLEKRFKNILTINTVVRGPVMAGGHDTNGDKMLV